jgi:recombination protein RecA
MEELIEQLKQLVEAGTTKTTLEESIGLPKNSLSAVLKGKKMPESWIPKIEAFLIAPIAEPLQISGPLPEEIKERKLSIGSNGSLNLKPSKEAVERLNAAVAQIKKDFGEGAIMMLGDKPRGDVEVIPTGSLSLNDALGVGGLPKGRITEIYGPESSGKTTLALHVVAEAQKRGGKCAFIDVEHAFDETYARAIGVNTDALYFSQPDYGEQALEEADRLIMSGGFAVVVVDSVAALVPKGELEGEMGDTKMGLQARLMSQACRKLTGSISKTGTICIFINQLRSTIGNMYVFEVTCGGNALKFYASVRLDVRRSGKIVDGEEQLGNKVKVKVVKNKVAPPFKTAEFDILFGQGIDYVGEVIDTAIEKNIIKKSGSWYSYGEMKLGQGREGVRDLLKSNDELLAEIETKL